jgi:hypothetical protein
MGADQTAAIRPALRELFDAITNGEQGADKLCITFEVPGESPMWVQVMQGTINAGYARAEDPMDFVRDSGLPAVPGLTLIDHGPQLYATWSHEPCMVKILAEFIDQLLIALHSLPPDDYEIDVKFENL